MFSSCLRSRFSYAPTVDQRKQRVRIQDYELLRQSRVCFKPTEPLQQLLTPLDLFPFCFRHYLPWAVFFNYDIELERLAEALHIVAQKYLMLSGRLCTDDKGRYAIEVGSIEGKQYDFPVVEMKANMQMAEAVLRHGKSTVGSAKCPVHPDKLPFYLKSLNIEAIHKGHDAFLSVKLTHFLDGCCLAISICHFLVDGMRLSELYRDISRAYCGKAVPTRDINRQYMTLEGFSQHFSTKDKEDCTIPDTMPTGREPLTIEQYPNESASLEGFYLSKRIIDDMKSRVAPFIPKGSFVSTADLMHALLWMLDCELNVDCGEITNGADLGVSGTMSAYNAELRINGLGVVPSNYLGNAVIDPVVFAEGDFQSKSLIEVLASLASLTRQKQIDLRGNPAQVFKLLTGKYSPCTIRPKNLRAITSNGCKYAISETDFGKGVPGFFLCHNPFPLTLAGWSVSTAFHDDGVLLHLMLTGTQKERLQKSSVLKGCAPGIKRLFDDFNVTELSKLMKKSDNKSLERFVFSN